MVYSKKVPSLKEVTTIFVKIASLKTMRIKDTIHSPDTVKLKVQVLSSGPLLN